jgi:hypothetical protein
MIVRLVQGGEFTLLLGQEGPQHAATLVVDLGAQKFAIAVDIAPADEASHGMATPWPAGPPFGTAPDYRAS